MRRLSDRARLEGMLALRKALEGVRRSAPALVPGSDAARASLGERREADDLQWLRRAEAERDLRLDDGPVDARSERDLELSKALNRIADSIERIGSQLDSYHLERADHLDAIEFLLREMVIGSVPATGARSVVLGGVVDPDDLDQDDITVIPDGHPLEVDTAVEVRSRFHDRWISGFSIAESVDTAGRRRYRLTRRSDGIPLPILFEACDVRAASPFDRPPVAARPTMTDARRR